MNSAIRCSLLSLSVLFFVSLPASAGLILTVVDHDNPALTTLSLSPGDVRTFDVILSGLNVGGGQTLDYLAATINYDGTLLGTPTVETPGSIIPDPSAVLKSPGVGVADLTYDASLSSLANPNISTNGVFFSFTLKALNPPVGGTTTFSFSFAAADDPSSSEPFPNIPNGQVGGVSTLTSIEVGPSAVPEPATMLMALSGICILAATRIGRLR
jgi:hypothetical protein